MLDFTKEELHFIYKAVYDYARKEVVKSDEETDLENLTDRLNTIISIRHKLEKHYSERKENNTL